jgi:hypothetical protein
MTLTFYNAGPSNITAADLTLNLSSKEGIRLIGIEGKDFAAAISQPIWWMTPQATPWPSEFGYYSFPIKDFERGDYFYVFLLFEVDDLLDSIIRKQRDALGFEVVEHPSFVGAYAYDRSNVNNEAYMEFVRMFINKITLSGQYINVIGEVP